MSKNIALLHKLLLCAVFIAISTSARAQTLGNSSQAEITKLIVSNSKAGQYSASSINSNDNGVDNKDSFLYTSKDGSYTALFPGKPKEKVEKPIIDQDKFITTIVSYGTSDQKYYYTVITDKYFKKLSKEEIKYLFRFIDESKDMSEFKYKGKFIFNGYETHEYINYTDNRWDEAIKTRIFFDVRKSTLYKISVSTGGEGLPSGSLDTPKITSFFNSLKLKNSAKSINK